MKEDELLTIDERKLNLEGEARAAAQRYKDACAEAQKNMCLPSEEALNSWTVGCIWSKSAHDWVKGYARTSTSSCEQRFIVHMDSGNSARTIIHQTAFDFLGLAHTAEYKGRASIHGVTGHSQTCPVYEIMLSLDVVDSLKPGTRF